MNPARHDPPWITLVFLVGLLLGLMFGILVERQLHPAPAPVPAPARPLIPTQPDTCQPTIWRHA